jgi:hypothetical protein
MKMVKKCIFALAFAALLVTTIHAATPDPEGQPGGTIKRDGDWPWTYKSIDICTMPIYIEVGHFVQIKECHKRKIELVQVDCDSIAKGNDDFPCYTDCEDIEVRANFPAIFGAKINKIHNPDESTGNVLKETKAYWLDDKNQIEGSTGGWEKLTVCVDAWKTEIWKAITANKKIKVGELVINVKPPDGP